MATAHNREYQRQKELLYLEALSLTGVRHRYAQQWFGAIDARYTRDAADESVDTSGDVGFNQALADGGQFFAGLGIDWIRFLTGDPRTSLASVLDATLRQPLLRGRGRRIAQEDLTQAERDVLYAIRTFNRYRKQFVVSVISDYYRVLQRRNEMENGRRNWVSLEKMSAQHQKEYEEGVTAKYQWDQARQSELSALDSYKRAIRSYERALDDFKIVLSLPTDANVVLDQNELTGLQEIGPTGSDEMPYSVTDALWVALRNRLDLANRADYVFDAARKVEVAADGLGMQLDLVGSMGVNSKADTDLDVLQFHEGTYRLGLESDLPLDRKTERNTYRTSLISLMQAQRAYENEVSQVKLEVRQAYRTLLEEAESYETQLMSLELAEQRVAASPKLWEAGRVRTRDLLEAEDALLRARNSVASALINNMIAKLTLFRDVGILEVKPDGMWEQGQ
jgi:outer membrane protein TolC